MSLRTSRRSQAAAAASTAVEEAPSVPISEIRVRKWSKQIKTVGHITIMKWVPEQEFPTEALQRGAFKKTKGRKRPVAEVGRMTRSVRQHLDAPLELLVEMPPARPTRATAGLGIVPTPSEAALAAAQAAPVAAATTENPAPPAPAVPAPAPAEPASQPQSVGSVASSESLMGMSSDSMMFTDDVASEEQLEEALGDLPFLDSDNLAMDPALSLEEQQAPQQHAAKNPPAESLVAQPSPDAEASAASAEDDAASSSSDSSDDDDDDDDDGNETASVDSATPQQSPSPTMSRSPSP